MDPKKTRITSWLMEWESHEAFNKRNEEPGEEFNALVNPASDWDDTIRHLSDAASSD
jgi:hypothetical protein